MAIHRGIRHKIRKNLRQHGLLGTCKVGLWKIAGIIRDLSPRRRRFRSQERQFDSQFGVNTDCFIRLSDIDITSENARYGTPHQATPAGILPSVLSSLNIRYENFVFIDLGSGMGRALLMASEFPFHKIVGVEFSQDLHKIALANVQRYTSSTQKCKNIELLCLDASNYSFPPTDFILYMFNPFSIEVLARVLANLGRSLKAKAHRILVLSYEGPRLEDGPVRSLPSDLLNTCSFLTYIRTLGNCKLYEVPTH